MGSKVLIVEDQASMAAMVRHHVETAGFEVLSASDVDAAWDLLLSEQPEAAIVDIQLPGKDGWDLISKSRVDDRTRHVPLVVLTALHGREVREQAEAFGAEYFTKPFAASVLINKLRSMVPSSHQEPTVAEIIESGEIPDTPEVLLREPFLYETEHQVPPPPTAAPVERTSPTLPDLGASPLDLVAVQVVLLLPGYQVEGTIHMPSNPGRFSDSWEQMYENPRTYVPVTDAKVIVDGGPRAIATTQFLQVRKTDVKGIFPTG